MALLQPMTIVRLLATGMGVALLGSERLTGVLLDARRRANPRTRPCVGRRRVLWVHATVPEL